MPQIAHRAPCFSEGRVARRPRPALPKGDPMTRFRPLRPTRPLGGALLALALTVALAAPAHAAPRGGTAFFASGWRLLSALWAEIGLESDPSGRSLPSSLFSEIGLEADPDGRTAPAMPPASDIGLEADPSGLQAH